MKTEADLKFQREVELGQRYEFGKNWAKFLSVLDDERIQNSVNSLSLMLGSSLEGKSFIDIGSGSGLSSLAAMRMGASRVHSIDYDPSSVACGRELKKRYYPESENWTIEEGSALDLPFLERNGQWDVVYSWGVLHHTGSMWEALGNVAHLVAPGGTLFVSIYNDQGGRSKMWKRTKAFYNKGAIPRFLVSAVIIPYWVVGAAVADLAHGKSPASRYRNYKSRRGMSIVRDWFDWLGGYPFEVAKPEEIFAFYRERGFVLEKMKTCGGKMGCNELVFTKAVRSGEAGS